MPRFWLPQSVFVWKSVTDSPDLNLLDVESTPLHRIFHSHLPTTVEPPSLSQDTEDGHGWVFWHEAH